MTTRYFSSPFASEKLEEVDEEEQYMWQSEQQILEDDVSSMSSSPSIPDENINFDLVYALHTFVATVEGQASVVKGDALILMEDTNIYWWLVEVIKTHEVGYIPAENIETPYERLARLNKHRNIEITSPSAHDTHSVLISHHPLAPSRQVSIEDESMYTVYHYEVESEIDQDEQLIEEEDEEDNIEEEEQEEDHQMTLRQSSEYSEMMIDDASQEWQEKQWSEERDPPEQNLNQYEAPIEANEVQEEPKMELRVFAGNIGQGPLFHTFSICQSTTADELLKTATTKFGLLAPHANNDTTIEYYLAVQGMDGDEYILSIQDKPFSIFKTLTDSLTTPMPSLSYIRRISQQSISSIATPSRRPRSSSFSNYEQTSYDEDSVIRFYLHRRIKRAHEREGLLYIKVSLYPEHQQKKKRMEIDRMDKIIPVRQESHIGDVINFALEKFHVPDAQAFDYIGGNKDGFEQRDLVGYKMYVRGNHQEIELDSKQLMSTVLLQQQKASTSSGPITSDLLFVLRRAGHKPLLEKFHPEQQQQQQCLAKEHPSPRPTDRRPSILDILMDNTPRMGERRPSVMSNLLVEQQPPPRLTEQDNNNRRPSGSTNNNHLQQQNTSFPFSSSKQVGRRFSQPTISSEDRFMEYDTNTMKQEVKKKESFRQQLKRFVGWGSSAANKKQQQQQQQQQQTPPPLTIESSDISFVSAPSTPLPPTPSTLPKSRQGSQCAEATILSRRPSETPSQDPSMAALAAAAMANVSNKRLSTVSSVSSVSSSVTSEEIVAATSQALVKADHDSETEDNAQEENDGEKEPNTTQTDNTLEVANEDIQAQYTMWMNTANNNIIEQQEEESKLRTKSSNISTVSKPTLSNKDSIISNATSIMAPAASTHAPSTPTPTPYTATTTAPPSIISDKTTEEQPKIHSMPSNDLDDLFLLVAHGVDFLTSKENSKWEEEGGYDFHPWNRPESSFAAVRQQEKKRKESLKNANDMTSEDEALAMAKTLLLNPTVSEEQQQKRQVQEQEQQLSPPSPALSVDTEEQKDPSVHMAKSILGAKSEVQPNNIPQQQSVDDEELQRIVAAHIVF